MIEREKEKHIKYSGLPFFIPSHSASVNESINDPSLHFIFNFSHEIFDSHLNDYVRTMKLNVANPTIVGLNV